MNWSNNSSDKHAPYPPFKVSACATDVNAISDSSEKANFFIVYSFYE